MVGSQFVCDSVFSTTGILAGSFNNTSCPHHRVKHEIPVNVVVVLAVLFADGSRMDAIAAPPNIVLVFIDDMANKHPAIAQRLTKAVLGWHASMPPDNGAR